MKIYKVIRLHFRGTCGFRSTGTKLSKSAATVTDANPVLPPPYRTMTKQYDEFSGSSYPTI